VKREKLIKELNKEFPGINAVPGEEFYGTEADGSENGIWFRGTESAFIKETHSYTESDGTVREEVFHAPILNLDFYIDTFGTHPKLEKFLQDNGWYSEPYDAGTLFAYV